MRRSGRRAGVPMITGIVLLLSIALALLWANSPFSASYFQFQHAAEFWINDVLMGLFFLEVGLEIRASLTNIRHVALPVIAACGGVLAPALICLTFDHDAWAIPTATDIAFALGVLSLLGRAVPGNVRLFLLTLAVADDIGAILIIAVFYTSALSISTFVALGGVTLGMLLPSTRIQHAIHPWVSYGIMPLFALVNAGIVLGIPPSGPLMATTGVALALLIGKPVGVAGATWVAVRLGWGQMPTGMSWNWLWLIGLLAGIGFTMSLFIATLTFSDPLYLGAAKLGVLLGSTTAAVLGLCWGRRIPGHGRCGPSDQQAQR
jgi:Na+:H+ antiporter, NhaA family